MLKWFVNNEITAIEKYLTGLGWKRDINYGGEIELVNPDYEYQVAFGDQYWTLGEFTDGDIDGVAVGRFRYVDEGTTLVELQAALQDIKAVR